MIHFDTDYMEGAHPEIMRRLVETNLDQTTGYGTDPYTAKAKELIRKACGKPDAAVYFLVGGTQTNATVIDALLDKFEGVLAAETAHINVHEAGAIEASGHKVLTLPQHDGKVNKDDVEKYITDFYRDDTYEHMVAPGMLYISHPTEFGTLYTLEELKGLKAVCQKAGIPLYMDGARLGYGLATDSTNVTLKDIAEICDVFYIGGTKVGALFGEAVVAADPNTLPHFFPIVKQHGALLAKGRLLGVQFEALFTNNMYLEILTFGGVPSLVLFMLYTVSAIIVSVKNFIFKNHISQVCLVINCLALAYIISYLVGGISEPGAVRSMRIAFPVYNTMIATVCVIRANSINSETLPFKKYKLHTEK